MAKRNMPTKEQTIKPTTFKVPVIEKSGLVVNCEKLNIRLKPNLESRILLVVEEGTMLTINPVRSTHNWYSVKLDDETYGYCMRDYVAIDEGGNK